MRLGHFVLLDMNSKGAAGCSEPVPAEGRQDAPYTGGPAAWGSQTKADHGCTENANEEQRTGAKLFEICAMRAARAPHAPTLVNAPEDF